MKKEKYEIIWTFKFYDDIIIYKRTVECCPYDAKETLIDYAIKFVEKYGEKYGKCLAVAIKNPVGITNHMPICFSTDSITIIEFD